MYKLALLSALIISICLLAQQAPPQASVEGEIRNGSTAAALPKAKVILLPMAPPASSRSATTDDAGHFLISGIEPGQYHLRVAKDGFLPQEYGAQVPDSAGSTLILTAGTEMKAAGLKLMPQSAVAGRVTNRDGSPLPNVLVQCLKATYVNGQRQLAVVAGSGSNDLGEYRIHGLSPGRYYLHASYRLRSLTDETYAPIFYPNSPTAESASPLEVSPGAQLSSMDFLMPAVRAFTIRGRAVDEQTSVPANAMITLSSRGSSGGASQVGNQIGRTNAKGEFEFAGIAPGSYLLMATTLPREGSRLTATVSVEVGSANQDVSLRLRTAGRLTGRISIEEGAESKSKSVMVQLHPRNGSEPLSVKADIGSAFVLGDVLQDEYTVTTVLPPGLYAKSIRLGDAVLEGPIDYSTGTSGAELRILLAAATGEVTGAIHDAKGDPAPGVQVVLVPAQSSRLDLLKVVTSAEDGRYRMGQAAPGDYKVFAWRETEPGAVFDPQIRQSLERSAERITLQNGNVQSKDLVVAQ